MKIKTETDGQKIQMRWMRELAQSDAAEQKWRDRARKVVNRYRDERETYDKESKFNILYANTEILGGAVYAKKPNPIVRRRWNDTTPVAIIAARILERCLIYSMERYDFHATVKCIVQDSLLPGRGLAKAKYVPTMAKDERRVDVSDDDKGDDILSDEKGRYRMESYERVEYEEVRCDYVDWEFFRFSPAKRWDKVWWVAFGELLTRNDLIQQFGDKGKEVKLTWKGDSDEAEEGPQSRAKVWTIWNKRDERVYVVSEGYESGPLSVVDDPLKLEGFFPTPKPVYDVWTTDSLTPIPNYCMYQDQAKELDMLTQRITVLTDGLRRRGVFDQSYPELAKLAKAGDNEFIPIENYAGMTEKGGLEKAITQEPLEALANILMGLYKQRDQCKQIIYEVTGISDVLRGASNPEETATAQQIKSQYGSIRIQNRQQAVQRFVLDLLKMKAEIIAEHFSPQTLMDMSGIKLPTTQEKQQMQMQYQQQAQMAQQQGQQPPKPPPDVPSIDEVMKILKSDKLRGFSIEIETDSMIAIDEQGQQKAAGDMLTALGGVVKEIMPAVQMQLIPFETAKTIMKFALRKFSASRDIEDSLEQMQPPPPQQSPQMQQQAQQLQQQQQDLQKQGQQLQQDQQQLQQKSMQQDYQTKMAEMQAQIDRLTHEGAMQKQANDLQLKGQQLDLQSEEQALQLEAALLKIQAAAQSAEQVVTDAQAEAIKTGEGQKLEVAQAANDQIVAAIQQFTLATQQHTAAVMAPKEIVRDPAGRAVGVQPVLQ